jgi:peptidoglycan/xylan/chitin deacetylase (PgdA/CDA1 family)
MFTFDIEEDWENTPFPCYYDSYNYIDSGTLRELVNGLSERNISATFYVTPNVARKRPDELKYLEKNGQRIGVHLHVHNLMQKVKYPYYAGKEDNITSYDFRTKIKLMKIAKSLIESVLGHEIILFRSGRLACDYQVEIAAKLLGFKAISNHAGVFIIKPLKLWNLGAGTYDLFTNLRLYAKQDRYIKLFNIRKIYGNIIIFSAHPMLLYDRRKGQRKDLLKAFFNFLTALQSNNKVEVIEQHELLTYLNTKIP